jgi:hypothetical protein
MINLKRAALDKRQFKLQKGLDPLIEKLDRAGVSELLDLKRKNVCKKRLGLF